MLPPSQMTEQMVLLTRLLVWVVQLTRLQRARRSKQILLRQGIRRPVLPSTRTPLGILMRPGQWVVAANDPLVSPPLSPKKESMCRCRRPGSP